MALVNLQPSDESHVGREEEINKEIKKYINEPVHRGDEAHQAAGKKPGDNYTVIKCER